MNFIKVLLHLPGESQAAEDLSKREKVKRGDESSRDTAVALAAVVGN